MNQSRIGMLLALPLEGLYRLLVGARTWAYRSGWREVLRAPAPVIAIGNLVAGGSGKTPMAEYVARLAAQVGLRAVCLSRGHGRRSRARLARVCVAEGIPPDPLAVGDENAMLAIRNPGLPVYAGADRYALARMAALVDQPDVMVLDDAFQHLRLHRDLNVLLVDAAQGLDNGHLLPAGLLREPVQAASRADIILITKANLGAVEPLRAALSRYARAPIFTCDYHPTRLVRLDGARSLPADAIAQRAVTLLCGIARPDSLHRTMDTLDARVARTFVYPDHHPFSATDLLWLEQTLAYASAEGPQWITTEKDAVKLRGRLAAADRLWVLEMEVRPDPAARDFFFDYLKKLKLE